MYLGGLQMKNKNRELANRKFVQATILLENAHDVAIAGQSPKLSMKACARYAGELKILATKLQGIADSIETLSGRKSPKKT